jgi:hypothetical protein
MKRRDQLIVVGIVAAVLLAVFYLGLLQPKLKQSKALGKTLTAVQAQRSQAQATLAAAQAAQATYVSNVTTISSLTPAIPATDSTSTLLRELNSAARSAGVDFSTITLSGGGGGGGGGGAAAAPSAAGAHPSAASTTPPIPPGYSASGPTPSVSYTLTFRGGYLKLQKFLAAVQHFVALGNGTPRAKGRLLDVQGVSITKGAVTMNVIGYLLAPSDQTPLPLPRNAPIVPGIERASVPGSASKTGTQVASAGAHS